MSEPTREDELIFVKRGKKLRISLSKLDDGSYSKSQLDDFYYRFRICAVFKDTNFDVLREIVRREHILRFGTNEEKLEIQCRDLKQQNDNLKTENARLRKISCDRFDYIEKLEEEIRSLKILLKQEQDNSLAKINPLFRACQNLSFKDTYVNPARKPGDIYQDLTGDEFITIVRSLTSFNKRNIDYIVKLAKGLIEYNENDKEKFKDGANFYGSQCDAVINWEEVIEEEEEDEEEDDKEIPNEQRKLLKWLKEQNPTVYRQIIGVPDISFPTVRQIGITDAILNKYDIDEPYYTRDLIDFLKKNQKFYSMESFIKTIFPLVSKCVRCFFDQSGIAWYKIKKNEYDTESIILADKFPGISDYKVIVNMENIKGDIEPKSLNVIKWVRDTPQLFIDPPEKIKVDTQDFIKTQAHSLTTEVCYNWNLTIDRDDIKIENGEIWVHAETIQIAFERENKHIKINPKTFSRDILSKNENFEKIGKKYINKSQKSTYKIRSSLYESIMIRRKDGILFSLTDLI